MALKTDQYGNVIENTTGQDYKFDAAGNIDYSRSGSNYQAPQGPTAAQQAAESARQSAINNGQAPSAYQAPASSSGLPAGYSLGPNGQWNTTPSELYGGDQTMSGALAYAQGQANQSVPTEEEAYQNKLKLFQSDIDATNRIYADKIAEANRAGLGRVGSSNARQAKAGLLGSDFGAAQDEETARYNRSIIDSYANENSAAIAEILGKARSESAKDIADKRAAKEAGYKTYVDYLTQSESKKKGRVTNLAKSLIAQGIDIKTMKPAEIDELARSYGVTKDDILATYATEKQSYDKEQAAIKKAENQSMTDKYGTGAIGEYNFAKENGYTGSFTQYQNEDANRKAIAIGASGLTGPQATLFSSLVDKYNKSPLVAAADRTIILKNTIDKIKANPSDSAQQMNLSYAYIQALDTYQSAVREGELSNLNTIDSKIGSLGNAVQQIRNGQIVRPEVALQIATAAEDIIKAINAGAQQKALQYGSQANALGVKSAWDSYQSGYSNSYNNAPQVETRIGTDGKTYYKVPGGWSDEKPSFNGVGSDTKSATSLESAKAKIAKIESSGRYDAVSPTNRSGEKAYGKYQILESNIPSWSREALGRNVTLQEYLSNPDIQEQIADYQMTKIYNKYGNWDDVASVWFSGKPLAGNNATDITGTSVHQYVNRFNEA